MRRLLDWIGDERAWLWTSARTTVDHAKSGILLHKSLLNQVSRPASLCRGTSERIEIRCRSLMKRWRSCDMRRTPPLTVLGAPALHETIRFADGAGPAQALHVAIANNRHSIARLLFSRGADTELYDFPDPSSAGAAEEYRSEPRPAVADVWRELLVTAAEQVKLEYLIDLVLVSYENSSRASAEGGKPDKSAWMAAMACAGNSVEKKMQELKAKVAGGKARGMLKTLFRDMISMGGGEDYGGLNLEATSADFNLFLFMLVGPLAAQRR